MARATCSRVAVRFSVLLLFAAGLLGSTTHAALPLVYPTTSTKGKPHVVESYGKLSLSFEPNQGQTDRAVKFLSRGQGYTLFLTPTEAVLALRQTEAKNTDSPSDSPTAPESTLSKHRDAVSSESSRTKPLALRMRMLDANDHPAIAGLEALSGKVNYLKGDDPKLWQKNVPTYAKVKYSQVYPGIDLVYYGNQQRLEYDFVIQPGANPKNIRLQFEGAEGLSLEADGNLVLTTKGGELRLQKPVIYQDIDGERRKVDGGFVIEGGANAKVIKHETAQLANTISFHVAAYDPTKPLIIDPELVYSTYLGGSDGKDKRTGMPFFGEYAAGVAVDSGGNALVVGTTWSMDFPKRNARYPSNRGSQDVFVTKFDPSGHVVYSTYLGGSEWDAGADIAVDAQGNAYVTGTTYSSNFPKQNARYPKRWGAYDAFVTKFNPTGQILYSTYLGGHGGDNGIGIATDRDGNAYITGLTNSSDFLTVNARYPKLRGWVDAFVTKFNASGQPIYSTYLGGSDNSQIGPGNFEMGNDIAVDRDGNAYIAGVTDSSDFPHVNALYPSLNGLSDGFVTVLSSSGKDILFSTYLGGSSPFWGDDPSEGIAVDAIGNIYVAGNTWSSDFPLVNAENYNPNPSDNTDFTGYLVKLKPMGSGVIYSTYFSIPDNETTISDVAVDDIGNAYITGLSGPKNSGFVAYFTPEGKGDVLTTIKGFGRAIASDNSGNIYVSGETSSSSFNTKNAAYSQLHGVQDAFIEKLRVGVFKTPEQPVYTPPFSPPLTQKEKHLVLLIHGWRSNHTVWSDKMKASIIEQIKAIYSGSEISSDDERCSAIDTNDVVWHVCYYDWANEAYTSLLPPDPWQAYVNALDVGKKLAQDYFNKNYRFISFISHSAGSQVADTAAMWIKSLIDHENNQHLKIGGDPDSQLKKPIIHTTFFDAFDPRGADSPYGLNSEWAEQYFDARRTGESSLDDTDITLPYAYNFDITNLDLETTDILGLHAHAWPYIWYQSTVESKSEYTYGFGLSRIAGGNPSHNDFPKGSKCIALPVVKTCSQNNLLAAVTTTRVIIEDVLNAYEIANAFTSTTGTISLLYKAIKLVTGSPAWVTLSVELPEPVNTLTFDYSFLRQAEGLLSVFVDDQRVYRADERITQTGALNHSDKVPLGMIPSGTHTISFRLDAFNDTQSEIDITNVQLARIDVTNPPNQPPIAQIDADLAVRLGSTATLNGSSSLDPDSSPAALAFNWKQTAGTDVDLTGLTMANPTFTAPVQGEYSFELLVNDGEDDSSPARVTIWVPRLGDLDEDDDVDNDDLSVITAALNLPAIGPNDLRDLNGDLKIDALDARKLTLLCTRPRCATE